MKIRGSQILKMKGMFLLWPQVSFHPTGQEDACSSLSLFRVINARILFCVPENCGHDPSSRKTWLLFWVADPPASANCFDLFLNQEVVGPGFIRSNKSAHKNAHSVNILQKQKPSLKYGNLFKMIGNTLQKKILEFVEKHWLNHYQSLVMVWRI